MKFLVFALCICATSAASWKSWPQPEGGFARATAQVSAPNTPTVVETVGEPEVVVSKTSGQYKQPSVHAFAKSVVKPYSQEVKSYSQPIAKTAVAHAQTTGYKSVKVVDSDANASVLRSETDVSPEGFNYAYETSNGIAAASTGTLKKVDNVDTLTVQGQYQYISPEGVPVQLSYVADEYGYQPKGDILPVGPPVPVAIARSLEYIAAHTQNQKTQY
ncbi:hypothetical protein ACJJTC_015718 [Scirpophaga incertulas]